MERTVSALATPYHAPALTNAYRFGQMLQIAFTQQAAEAARRIGPSILEGGEVPNLNHWPDHLAEMLRPTMVQLFQQGIVESRRRIAALGVGRPYQPPQRITPLPRFTHGKQLGMSFDLFDPRVLRAVDKATMLFCEETNDTATTDLKTAIRKLRELIKRGLEKGKAISQLAREVKRIFADPARAFRIAATECLTGDCVLRAANLKGIYRRSYRGTLVKAVVEGGQEITGTRNHPVLTTRGWVALGNLQEYDHLVCNSGGVNRPVSSGEDNKMPPTPLNKVFDSLTRISVVERVPMTSEDFHGDGSNGYVDILAARGLLRYGCLPSAEQLAKQLSFVGPDPLCPIPFNRCRCLFGFAPMVNKSVDVCFRAFGDACFSEKSFNLPFVHGESLEALRDLLLTNPGFIQGDDFGHDAFRNHNIVGTNLACASLAVTLATCFNKQPCTDTYSSYSESIMAELTGKRRYRGTSLIEPDDLGSFRFSKDWLEGTGLCSRPELYSNCFTGVLHNPVVSTEQGCYCRETHATQVEFRRLSSLRFIEDWHGYVFNLGTLDGYYDTNGIITKNSSRAVHSGALYNARESSLNLKKEWLASADACDRCQELADMGPIELDEPFTVDGTGPYAKIMHPPLHPHCFCTFSEAL